MVGDVVPGWFVAGEAFASGAFGEVCGSSFVVWDGFGL